METAGIGDPYWYEWTVGLINIIDMLDESSKIKSVTLQKNGIPGLDDVVVEYTDGPTKNYQVKHSRVGDSLTFGDLVSSKSKDKSLLKSLNEAWKALPSTEKHETILYTNRAAGQRASNTQSGGYRPALSDFWSWLCDELKSNRSLDDFNIPDGWASAWTDWIAQLIGNNDEKIEFLHTLEIQADEYDLQELEKRCCDNLARIFGIPGSRTTILLALLDSQLRVWTTSTRKKERITREDVYQALIKSDNLSVQPYVVETPHPFFPSREKFAGEFEKLITQPTNENPVYFLCGDPGSGKSSLISYLSWRSEPVIDLRYFAFRPISPDMLLIDPDVDDAASPKRLWHGLLTQFQIVLKGQLAEAKVPVIFDYMSVDELRSHVLRLAVYYAEKRGRDVIIAIDGLDHAARAKRRGLSSLIDSLIPPSSIPEGIRFIIAGQAPESYREYPFWLSSEQVTRINIPSLDRDDTLALLKANPLHVSDITLEAIADVIADIADGNTLATVFSVAEARLARTPEKLREVLSMKELNNGIETYYNHIWDTAVDISPNNDTVDMCASALALSPSKITGEMLQKTFIDFNIPVIMWTSILRKLQPLVIEDDTGFMVAHNDVRLFLEQKAGYQKGWIKDVASLLANYHLNNNSTLSEKHASVFRLLGLAQRNTELPQVFTPEWVVEAASLQRNVQELDVECQAALHAAISNKNWKELISTLCGARTLERWEHCRRDLPFQHHGFRYRLPPGFLISESRLLPDHDWTIDIVNQLMTDLLVLIDSERIDRATSLAISWLGNKSIEDVLTACDDIWPPDNPTYHITQAIHEEQLNFNPQIELMLSKWGQVSSRLQLFPPEPPKLTDLYTHAEPHFVQGVLTSAARNIENWPCTIDNLPRIYNRNILESCQELHDQKCWKEIAYLLKRCSSNKIKGLDIQLLAWGSYWLLLANEHDIAIDWINTFKEKDLSNLAGHYAGSEQTLMVVIAFILGVIHPEKDAHATIAQLEGVRFCLQDELPTLKKLMLAAITAGRIAGAYLPSRKINANALITPSEISNAVRTIITPPELRHYPVAYFSIVNETLLMLIHSTKNLSTPHQDAIYNAVSPTANEFPIHDAMTSIWKILEHHGDYQTLHDWADSWKLGSSKLSSLRYDERLETAQLFERLCRSRFPDLADSFKKAANFSQIGYSFHKEYSLAESLTWLQGLAIIDPEIWISYGIRLLALSRSISDRGADNREQWEIEPAIAGLAAQYGPQHFASYLFIDDPKSREDWLEVYSPIIRKALMHVAKNSTALQSTQALVLWSIAIGASRWFTKEDQYDLAKLRDALMAALNSDEDKEIFTSVTQQLTPAEASAEHEPDRTVNPRHSQAIPEDPPLQLDSSLPINECLDILEDNTKHNHFNHELLHVITRMQVEHPAGYSDILKRVINISGIMNTSENWNWYSRTPIIHAAAPLLSEQQLWELAETILKDIDNESLDYALISNLFVLGQAVANIKGKNLLEHGLKELLNMHSVWYSGATRICEAPELTITDKAWNSWEEVSQGLLHTLLTSTSSETIAAALRGSNVLLEAVPARLESFWKEASAPAKSWLLLLLEAWAVKHPETVEPLSPDLLEGFYKFELEDRIQCALVLTELGAPPPSLFRKKPVKSSPIITISQQLLDIPAETVGIRNYTRLHSASISRLKRLQSVLNTSDEAADLIEDCIVKRLTNSISLPTIPYLHRRNDWLISGQDSSREFFACLDDLGGQYNAPYHAKDLLEAVGSSDEPWQLIHSPRIMEACYWPKDLTTDLKEQLLTVICEAHVPEGWTCVGATIDWFDSEKDYRLLFWLTNSPSQTPPIAVPCGRHILSTNPNRYRPERLLRKQPFVTFSGSITSFSHAAVTVMPSSIWPSFGWSNIPGTRGVWSFEGNIIAKHESWAGTVRDDTHGSHYRHPHMQRWIVNKATLEQTGLTWHPHIDFQADRYGN